MFWPLLSERLQSTFEYKEVADDLTKTEQFVIKPRACLLWDGLFKNVGLPFESFHHRRGVTTPGLYLQWIIVFQSYTSKESTRTWVSPNMQLLKWTIYHICTCNELNHKMSSCRLTICMFVLLFVLFWWCYFIFLGHTCFIINNKLKQDESDNCWVPKALMLIA